MRNGFGFSPPLAILLISLVSSASSALAASRLVVVPIVVGGGGEPDSALMTALAEGLKQNPQWSVEQGEGLPALAKFKPEAAGGADVVRLENEVNEAARKIGSDASGAAGTLERLRGELRAAAKKGPLGDKGLELAYRTSALLVSAHLAAKDAAKAKTAASRSHARLPRAQSQRRRAGERRRQGAAPRAPGERGQADSSHPPRGLPGDGQRHERGQVPGRAERPPGRGLLRRGSLRACAGHRRRPWRQRLQPQASRGSRQRDRPAGGARCGVRAQLRGRGLAPGPFLLAPGAPCARGELRAPAVRAAGRGFGGAGLGR